MPAATRRRREARGSRERDAANSGRGRFHGNPASAMPQRTGGKLGRHGGKGRAATLGTPGMAAAVDGVASGVENGQRFDPGVRLDCLDALKSIAREQEVRSALMVAAQRDQNAAVRMKALDALRDSVKEESVREMLLDVLQQDTNPGVRVEA